MTAAVAALLNCQLDLVQLLLCQVKSSQRCNDVDRCRLQWAFYVRIILETLLQLFSNLQCHTQINLRYRQGDSV